MYYIRAILRRAPGQAQKWGLVNRNVAALVDPPRTVRHQVQPLSPEQAREFIDHTHDDRLAPLFHVAFASGLRQGELFGLRWADVDFAAGTLTVRYAMQRVDGKPTFMEPKTPLSRRTVTLPASAVAALRMQHDRQTFERVLTGDRWQEWGLVFPSTVGTPLEPSNVIHRLHRLLADAELPRQRFHDLRHGIEFVQGIVQAKGWYGRRPVASLAVDLAVRRLDAALARAASSPEGLAGSFRLASHDTTGRNLRP